MLRDVRAHPYLEDPAQDGSVSLHHEKQEQEQGGGSEEKEEEWLPVYSPLKWHLFKNISGDKLL